MQAVQLLCLCAAWHRRRANFGPDMRSEDPSRNLIYNVGQRNQRSEGSLLNPHINLSISSIGGLVSDHVISWIMNSSTGGQSPHPSAANPATCTSQL